jgi:hypothetical protein
LIFSLLPLYIHLIPPTYTFRLGAQTPTPSSPSGITLTDKWALYILYAQLSLSQFPGSLICALTGYLTGLVWEFSLVPSVIKHFRLPRALFRLDATITQTGVRRGQRQVVEPQLQQPLSQQPAEPLAQNFLDTISGRTERPEIEGARERDVESLMGMFPDLTRERAVAVLGRSQNSVERAVEALLEG